MESCVCSERLLSLYNKEWIFDEDVVFGKSSFFLKRILDGYRYVCTCELACITRSGWHIHTPNFWKHSAILSISDLTLLKPLYSLLKLFSLGSHMLQCSIHATRDCWIYSIIDNSLIPHLSSVSLWQLL